MPPEQKRALRRVASLAALLTLGIALLYELSPLGETLQNRIAVPFEFAIRHWLKRDPKMDDRLKLYALGDSTLEILQQSDLSLEQWSEVFATIGQREPAAIFIDKVFGVPVGLDGAPRLVKTNSRKEVRWPIPSQVNLSVSTPFGSGRLVNFSESGLAFSLDYYLGRDVQVSLTLDSPDGTLKPRLADVGLIPIISEVRWGRPIEDGKYLTGILIKNLSKGQREKLIEELRRSLNEALPKKAA